MKQLAMLPCLPPSLPGFPLLLVALLSLTATPEIVAQVRHLVANEPMAAARPSFIRNDGQWDPKAKFLLRSPGLDLWITANGVVYDINRVERIGKRADRNRPGLSSIAGAGMSNREEASQFRIIRAPVFISFDGARTDAAAVGRNRREEHHNYFIGSDSSRWAEHVPLFGDVRIDGLYEGIDAVFYLDQGRPRYDLVVAPGADPSRISMKIAGARKVSVGRSGALRIATVLGTIEQRELFAYQDIGGARRQVTCRFVVDGRQAVRFDVGHYDRTRPLVIDPLVYSTYLGGSQLDDAYGITVDSNRNAYVCGLTTSANFPLFGASQSTRSGEQDAFVTKLTRWGARAYSTYLGGSGDADQAKGIAVTDSGNAYITGSTNSTNFPMRNPSQSTSGGGTDAFITKLTASGALSYSTYLGGAGSDFGTGIDVDVSGQAYIAGYTSSTNFPRLNPMQTSNAGGIDGFVTKLLANGARLFSTYVGGSAEDRCHAIEVDGFRRIYLTGYTASLNFPVVLAAQGTYGGGPSDMFIMRLQENATGISFSTYMGGSGHEIGTAIAVDEDLGNIYVTGNSSSTDYPTLNPSQATNAGGTDIVLTKMRNNTSLAHSTYLGGGSGDDYGYGIEVDKNRNIYIAGMTRSINLRTVDALQASYGGDVGDGFVMKLTDSGATTYSTYLGGNGEEFANALAIDTRGSAYIVGSTRATNFPTLRPSQPAIGGVMDAFVTRLSDEPIIEFLTPAPGTVWCAGTTKSITWISGGVTSVTIDISSNGGVDWTNLVASRTASLGSYSWAIPSDQTASTDYRVRIRAVGNAAVDDSSTAGFTINTPPVATITSPPAPVAFTDVTITSTGTGTPTPTVRWQQSADSVDYADIPGETSGTLTLRSVRRENHPRYYRAVYTNSCGVSNSAAVLLTVNKATAPVVLTTLDHVYDGNVKRATARTTPSGLTVDIVYLVNGTPVEAPTNAGSYNVAATIRDTNYEGTARGALVIARANATVVLSNLNHLPDGNPKFATATTIPPGLAVDIAYAQNGNPVSAPTAIGSYDVTATVTDSNYQGMAAGVLVISEKASAPDERDESVSGITARVVPNPIGDHGEIHIEGLSVGTLQATIHDMTGRPLKSMERMVARAGAFVLPIDLSGLASGFYSVRLVTARGTVTVGMQVVR